MYSALFVAKMCHSNVLYFIQEDEEDKSANETRSEDRLESFQTTEEILNYLDKKYSNRFTLDDPAFAEVLNRSSALPPIVINYNGKQQLHARRSNTANYGRRYHPYNQNQNDSRRYDRYDRNERR